MLTNKSFFASGPADHAELFPADDHAWQALTSLKEYLQSHNYPQLPPAMGQGVPLPQTWVFHDGQFSNDPDLHIDFGDATKGALKVHSQDGDLLAGASVIMAGTVIIGNQLSIGPGAKIEAGSFIQSPAIIGANSEVRQGAYLRGNCLVGQRCVVGHVTEAKHAIFLDDAKAGHFAYIGDSILGNDVNLGAGTKLANLRFLRGDVQIRTPEGPVKTGLRKLGAILGDHAQTGCNAVTNPGTLLGRKAIVLPNTTAPSGYHRDNAIIR